MTQNEMLDKARYIFTVGKLIHDKIFEAGAYYFNDVDKSEDFVELSLPQQNMIMIIRRQGAVTMTDLANYLGVSPPSASTMVDRLVEKKILSREHSTEDRRKVVVRISDEAVSMMDGIEKNVLGFFIELVEKIGPKAADRWCQILEQVGSVLESKENKTTKR